MDRASGGARAGPSRWILPAPASWITSHHRRASRVATPRPDQHKCQVSGGPDDLPMRERRTRTRTSRESAAGAARAGYLEQRLGIGLRERRLVLRMTQKALGARVGLSQSEICRLEQGHGATASLGTWAACAAGVGLQLAAFLEFAASADLPRDMEHLRRQNLVIAMAAPGGWAGSPEWLLPGDGPRPRSIDVLLTRAVRREAAVVEIWDLILDGGHAMRSLEAKVRAVRERLGEGWEVQGLLVVRATRRNRGLVRELGALFAARYPASSQTWLRALANPTRPMPTESGVAWTDVRGERLFAARLGQRA
jgi:transcriptional regulator with XRE-family HTH domain